MKNIKISTTLYVNIKTLIKIKTLAEMKNISTDKIITTLLRKTLFKYENKFKIYYPVKYQKKDPEKKWKRVHICFDGKDYELCTDMRKFYKLSVSLMLAYAVEEYLNDLLEDDGIKDNYQTFSYGITSEAQKGHLIWHTFWDKRLITQKNE